MEVWKMALKACPYMTARCPHYQVACQDDESKDCHYIKRTTASVMTAQVALLAAGTEQLTPEMKEYLQKTETFLK
jgi:hypothetical protein